MEPSPFNPSADENGLIPITNGTPIAGIPKNTVKVGVDYSMTDKWKVEADMVAASGQVIFGNENGALPQLPGYAVFGVHTSYQVGKQLQIYGLIQNIFDQRYYTSGGLFDITSLPNSGPFLTDPPDVRAGEALRHLRRFEIHNVTRQDALAGEKRGGWHAGIGSISGRAFCRS